MKKLNEKLDERYMDKIISEGLDAEELEMFDHIFELVARR